MQCDADLIGRSVGLLAGDDALLLFITPSKHQGSRPGYGVVAGRSSPHLGTTAARRRHGQAWEAGTIVRQADRR